jgi:hypothetical protein
MGHIFKRIAAVSLSFSALLSVGLLIWAFIRDSQTSLKEILFWVGAVPIAVFSVGLFGNFSVRGDASYQLSRSLSDQPSTQRAGLDLASMTKSGLNRIIAGLLLWAINFWV